MSLPLNVHVASLAFTSAFSAALGLFVLYKNRTKTNVLWAISSFTCSLWAFSYLHMIKEGDFQRAVFYAKATNVIVAFMVVFVAHFCKSVTSHKSIDKIILGYVVAAAILVSSFTDYFCTVSPFLNFKNYVYPLRLFHIYSAHFFAFVFYAIYILVKSLGRLSGQKKNQVQYILLALSAGYLAGMSTFLSVYRVPIEPIPSLFVWLYAAIISYAIVKHQLMDIQVVIRRTAYYSFFAWGITIFYILAVFLVHNVATHGFPKGFNAYSLPPLVGTIFFLFLGLLSVLNRPRALHKTLFAALCFETVYWQAAWFASFYSHEESIGYLSRLVYLAISFIPVSFYHFIVSYLKKRSETKYLALFYIFAIFLVSSLFTTDLFVAGGRRFFWGYFPLPGPFFVLFMAVALVTMVRGLLILRAEIGATTDDPARQNQIKFLFLGFALYFFCTLDFLQIYGATFYPVGTFFFIASCLTIAFAIFKHRLLDVRVVIKRTLFYTFFAFLISFFYVVFVLFLNRIFLGEGITKSYVFSSTALVLLIALLLRPIEAAMHRLLDKRFFKGTIQEISEQKKKLETELERRERLKSVGILAAGMAHEIKNPLTAIQTFAEYLPEKYDDPAFREKFSKIVTREVGRVKEIVSELLAFSRPSEPKRVFCDLDVLLNNLCDLIESQAFRSNVSIHRKFHGSQAFADFDQLKQAILNIMLNGIDAMGVRGGGTLSITTKWSGSNVLVCIKDTGIGIAPDRIEHIFDPFFTDKDEGTGLGLAVTHSLIEKNGGKITVSSVIGEGSEFIIELPARG